jgi:amino acid transporter
MWYSLGRNGAFPKLFAKTHPVYKTPTNAIYAQAILTLGTGIIAGAIWRSDVAFFLLSGLILVIGVSFVYLMANVGVIVYYWRQRKSEFNWLFHFIFPVVSGAVLIYALAESFPPFCPPQNCPALPNSSAPLVTGIWLVLGILVLVYFYISKRDKWISTAGAALGESEDDMAMARVGPGATAKV